MKTQTVAQLSRPLALTTRVDSAIWSAPKYRARPQLWRVVGSIVVRRAGRPGQIPMNLFGEVFTIGHDFGFFTPSELAPAG